MLFHFGFCGFFEFFATHNFALAFDFHDSAAHSNYPGGSFDRDGSWLLSLANRAGIHLRGHGSRTAYE